jgi:membrane protein
VRPCLFGIAKGYGFDALLAEKLRASLSGHEAVAERIIAFSSSTLENAKGGMIAGIGVLLLLWTVISLLSNIEGALNEIWGVHRGRPLLRKMSDYLSIVLICPVLIIVSGSATVYVASQVTGLSHSLPFGDVLNFLIAFALKALPFIATCGVFIFLYVFMPNTKVRWGSAIIAGLVAGCLYNSLQEVYVHTQIGVARNNAIYGSFAALPLFLVWLQLSWMIALFGAELSFAIRTSTSTSSTPATMA